MFIIYLLLFLLLNMMVGAYEETMYIDVSDVYFRGKVIPAATVKGSLLGPPIHVAVGERLRLRIELSSAIRDLSIHFHGFQMRGQQAYDGVVGLTQCAIRPGINFTYDFVVSEKAGTYWYHTHSGGGAGIWHNFIYGPLIVHAHSVPHKAYKIPQAYKKERIIFLSDVFEFPPKIGYKTAAGGLNGMSSRGEMGEVVGTHPWWGALLNGAESESEGTVIRVKTNIPYRFRVINGANLFAFNFSIPGIQLKVIATDATPLPCIDPVIVDSIFIWPAERYDFEVLFPTQMDNSTLSMQATTLESFKDGHEHHVYGLIKIGVLAPESVSVPRLMISPRPIVLNCYSLQPPIVCLPISTLAFNSKWCKHNHTPASPHMDTVLYNLSAKNTKVHFLDFKFNPSPQYSRMVSVDHGPYIQHVNPYYPIIGPTGAEQKLRSNTVLLDLDLDTIALLVLRTGNNMHHPMHIHGHAFEVLDQYTVNTNNDKHCSVFGCRLTDQYSETKLNILKKMPYTGLLKDTVVLPAGGAVVIRFEVDNPGVWFGHCHILLHKEDGMAFIIREGGVAAALVAPIPADSPNCLPRDNQSLYTSCQCREDADQLREFRLHQSWICSRDWLCHHANNDTTVSKNSFHHGVSFHGINKDTKAVLICFFTTCIVIGLLTFWMSSKRTMSISVSQFINLIGNRPNTNSTDHNNCSKWMHTTYATGNDTGNTLPIILPLSSKSTCFAVSAVWTEFVDEWNLTGCEIINPMRCVEVVGLALLSGSVFYHVGDDSTHRGLRESVSLLFFSVTLWTFTRMYPSIPAHHLWQKRTVARLVGTKTNICEVVTIAFVRCLVYFVAEGWWPVLFGMIAYPMAHLNNNIFIWFQNIVFLALNNLCYISFGAVVGTLMPSIQLGMICSTLYAQLSLVCAGFYRTIPHWLQWFHLFSYVFYTYSGILKGVYRYSDSYECRAGDSRVGQQWCLIETSGLIEDMQIRGINAADSTDCEAAKNVSSCIGMLLSFYLINCLLLIGALFYKLNVSYRNTPQDITNINNGNVEDEGECRDENEYEKSLSVLDKKIVDESNVADCDEAKEI